LSRARAKSNLEAWLTLSPFITKRPPSRGFRTPRGRPIAAFSDRFRGEYGEYPVARLEEQHIMAILDKKAATPAAANNLRRMLRAIMKLAKQRKMIAVNPMIEIEPIRYKVKGFKDWSDEEIALFANQYPIGTRERLALELLLCAAPRRSDVVRLKRTNVLDGRLIYRQRKTDAEINIPLLPQLEAAIAAMPMRVGQELFLETQYGEAFTETGFYNWFADKARKAGVPKGRSPHGLRKACCRRLAEAGCSPHEIMSVSGHVTLKEVERYTRAANRARLANSAIATLQMAQKGEGNLGKPDSKLANMVGTVSQSSIQVPVSTQEKTGDGGEGGIRTLETVSRLHAFQACAFNHSATSPAALLARDCTIPNLDAAARHCGVS